MNMGYLFIYVFFDFGTSVWYSLQCIDLLLTRLYFSVKYVIVFDAAVNEIIFCTLFSDNSLGVETLLNFAC